MSSPRDDDRPGDDPRDDPRPGHDPRPGDAGPQEPDHLGDGERSDERAPAAMPQTVTWGARPRTPSVVEQVFRYQGDTVGAQGWALQHGWTISDGTTPQDAVLAELVATAPVRATRDHRPAGVMRGRAGTVELVAFDVTFVDKRYSVPEYAVTAAPVLLPLPGLRLSPVRFWRHRTGGLLHVPSGDAAFDARWVLLAAEDGPGVRGLVADETVRGLLMASDDGDEFWSAAGHLAAVRPDGHRPELIEHHARLLGAMVAALAAAA
ncbi:hypothetical protein SAMN05660359_02545 [Geodermatophilus obscurus]|uniref:Uncharacterized protein n=1 Tax=Geodermatophilus obscurus TaxID=1861 RepID=A0A1I5G4V8_9ACTN|nr:hypothetical protein [Geodermatophilus obscurus]SFO30916.1 hypothetical protein SAMN05660359_02545 [Geodermatophilus obscurus]